MAASSLSLASVAAMATPTVLSIAVDQLTLQAAAGCYQMAVAYDPTNSQYYGGGGGNPTCNGIVWGATGSVLQNFIPINVDIRGVNYNSNTGRIETLGYGSASGYGSAAGYGGLRQMGLNGSGLYTGANSLLLAQLSGITDDQSVAAYDAVRDVFYSTANQSPTVRIASHSTGLAVGSITLTGHSLSNVMLDAIGYDAVNDVLVEYDYAANQALVFGIGGAFIGASQLSGSGYDHNYAMSYTNGMLFVGKGSGGGYEGFRILEAGSKVPEPTSSALVLLALGAGVAVRRRR